MMDMADESQTMPPQLSAEDCLHQEAAFCCRTPNIFRPNITHYFCRKRSFKGNLPKKYGLKKNIFTKTSLDYIYHIDYLSKL